MPTIYSPHSVMSRTCYDNVHLSSPRTVTPPRLHIEAESSVVLAFSPTMSLDRLGSEADEPTVNKILALSSVRL